MKKRFPNEVMFYLANMRVITKSVGRSGDKVYEGIGPYYNVFIKVSKNIDRLSHEKDIYVKVKNLLPVPEVLFWYNDKESAYLITKKIRGEMAFSPRLLRTPYKLIDILISGLKMFQEFDTKVIKEDIEKDIKEGFVFSHGDFCLPNIIIRQGKIAGFVDMGCAGINCIELDVATCLRSLEFNYHSKKYSKVFLEKSKKELNINADKVMELYPIVFS